MSSIGRKTIMSQPPAIFDTSLIARHLARRPWAGDFVTDLVVADLQDRLAALIRDFPRALIIGPDTVLPSEWMPFVWGENPPEWESGEQSRHSRSSC